MKSAVIVFPASNCDRDAATALKQITGKPPAMVWHGDAEVPDDTDLIVLPGGFSYGDYLRCGAMAAQSRIMRDVIANADKGVAVLGICNGFQILTETGLLPGVLLRNAGLKFVCRPVEMTVEKSQSAFTRAYKNGSACVPGRPRRRQLLRRDANARPDRGREPRRLPLSRQRQSERRRAQHRRHPQRKAQRPRHDAPSRTRLRSAARPTPAARCSKA